VKARTICPRCGSTRVIRILGRILCLGRKKRLFSPEMQFWPAKPHRQRNDPKADRFHFLTTIQSTRKVRLTLMMYDTVPFGASAGSTRVISNPSLAFFQYGE
jgi:hypothetical protein